MVKSFFEETTYKELRSRLDRITSQNQALWGSMNVAQMVKHCQYPIQIAMDKERFTIKPNWFVKNMFKRSMYNSKPYRKNLPTLKDFKIEIEKDFESEKEKLDQWMQELWYDRHNDDRRLHPIFGHFTQEQWGITQYKHLDHHFRQFGA